MIRLDFSSLPMYGRETERKLLLELYCQTCASGTSHSILVKGVSGAGKTTLVHVALQKAVQATGGFWFEGKFQDDGRSTPRTCATSNAAENNVNCSGGGRSSPSNGGSNNSSFHFGATKLRPGYTTAIVDALTQLLQNHSSVIDPIRIAEALGDEAPLLFQLIPPLREICAKAAAMQAAARSTNVQLSVQHPDQQQTQLIALTIPAACPASNDAYALDRFLHLFASLLKAVASSKHPLVFFLDDLQWADASSLRLLRYLMDHSDMKYVLFIASYRQSNANDELAVAPTSSSRGGLEQRPTQRYHSRLDYDFLPLLENPVTHVALQDLDFDDVNALIANAVGAPLDAVEPLTGVIYRKTGGNCFYVKQFLGMLQDEDYLYYFPTAACWEYDLDGIVGGTNVAENVADLVVGRLQHLRPHMCQVALQLASCLGFLFDTNLLLMVMREEHPELEMDEAKMLQCCQVLLKAGLVERALAINNSGSKLQLKFAHDRIQSCAYSMIVPCMNKKLLHLRIGFLLQRLYEQDPYFQQEWVFFSLVDQLNLGYKGIRELSELQFLVQLNLEAAKEAKLRSAFLSAAEYVEFALQLLHEGYGDEDDDKVEDGCDDDEEDDDSRGENIDYDDDEDDEDGAYPSEWKVDYDLCLELTSFAAEMYLCSGKLNESKAMAELVLAKAKRIEDKIRMFIVIIQLISATGDIKGGSTIGIAFLKDLGYQFPKRPNAMHVLTEVFATKRVLRHLSDDDILRLPAATDLRSIASIKLLTMVTTYMFLSQQSKSPLSPICACLLVQASIKNGLSSESAAGFALYGCILSMTGNMEAAQRYADVSIKLLERFPDVAIHALVSAALYTIIRPWAYPLHDSIVGFSRGHQAGLQSGTPEYGCLNAHLYCISSFICGMPLLKLASEQKRFVREAMDLKQESYALLLNTTRQMILNLLGYAEDPLVLTGVALQEADAAKASKDEPDSVERRIFAWCRLELGTLLNNISMVKSLLPEICKMRTTKAKAVFVFIRESFLAGLGFIRLSKTNSKYKRQARQHIARFEKWVKKSSVNCKHQLLLLKAQMSAAQSRSSYHTTELYDEAIFAASKAGFKNDEALSNELAGEYCKAYSDNDKAKMYILRAYQLYRDWGAEIKTDQLKAVHADIGLSDMVGIDTTTEALSTTSSGRCIRRHKKVSFAGQEQPPEENKMRQIESMDNLMEFIDDENLDDSEQRRYST